MIQPDRDVADAAMILQTIATRVEQARRHLNAEIRLCDGTPTSASGAQRNGGRGQRTILVKGEDEEDGTEYADQVPVTIVEQAAIRRQYLEDVRADLNVLTRGVLTKANEISRTVQRILSIRVEVSRCSATGRDGAIEWADPTCTAVPSRGPLCDRCSQREHRWRKLHNLPARTDGLFSGDAA